jgi:hypothetical protein
MMSWIITSILIAAFSAAALKLFGEDSTERASSPKLVPGLPSGPSKTDGHGFAWEHMTDSELDALVEEFSLSDEIAAHAAH